MSDALTPPADSERFTWLERPDDDFPYYRGRPVEITPFRWWVVMAAVVVGFGALIYPRTFALNQVGAFGVTILYFALPLAALAWAAGSAWTAIFRRPRLIDLLVVFGFFLLNYVFTLIDGILINTLTETTPNEAVGGAASLAGAELWLFFARTGLQLFGEEVMSILPFLALLYWLTGRRGLSRKWAIVVSVLIVAVLFAAAHLPTYGFNVTQALLGVGVARVILIIPYIITKNIWVSTATHVLYDWSNFALAIAAGAGGDA